MKPINLKVCAFGPYKDLVEIDFTKFDNKGLFLLTGKTGSGKTSIFDAICYALFDEASGSTRSKDNIRSDYANNKTKTFVTLSFMHNNKIYEITRYPAYLRDGYKTKTVADALLKFDDQEVTGQTNVNKKIIDILGIDSKQFKQIAMIAQGEFQQLLFASSSDRTIIFRNIFDTTVFNKVSELLKSRFLKINRSYEDTKLLIENEISNIEWSEDTSLLDTSCIIDKLKQKVDLDKLESDEINKKIEEINKKIISVNNELTIALRDNKDISELLRKQEELDNLKIDYDYNSNLLIEIEKQRILIPLIGEKNKLEKTILESNEELNLLNSKLDNFNKTFKDAVCEYNKLPDLNTKLENILKVLDTIKNNENIEKQINNIILKVPKVIDKNRIKKLEELTHDNNSKYDLDKANQDFSNDQKLLKEYNKDLKKILINEEDLIKTNKEYTKVSSDYDNLQEEVNNLELILLKNQAKLLALKLEVNKPCLVCGSKVHPDIASFDGYELSIDDLNEKKLNLESTFKLKNDLYNKIYALSSLINNSNKSDIMSNIEKINNKDYKIEEFNRKYQEYLNNMKELELLKEEIKNTEEETLKYNSDLVKIKTLKESIVIVDKIYTEGDYKCLKEIINKITCNYNDLSIKISKTTTSITLIKDLLVKNKMELETINNKIKTIDATKVWSLNELNSNVVKTNAYFNCINKLETIVDDLKIRTKNKTIKDTSNLENIIKSMNQEIQKIDKSVINRFNNNKKVLEKLSKIYNDNKNIEKQYSLYKMLSDTANGTLNKKIKINFEQYVQAYYFNEVIRNSNLRLTIITDGRYEFLRKSGSSNSKASLELEVFDYYTGKIRDVKTLSGGEIFKASLSLALGMSDTIQNYAGGINIETLFIDEGFGSLDNDSLEIAINTLIELSNDKLIGIISHVEELKNRIDKKIIVTSSNEGSKVDIVI